MSVLDLISDDEASVLEYPFIAIIPRATLTQGGSTW